MAGCGVTSGVAYIGINQKYSSGPTF